MHVVATQRKIARGILGSKALRAALLAACAMLLALPLAAHAANNELAGYDFGANLDALDQEEYVVTVDFGSKHAALVKACFEGREGFTVNGSKVSSPRQGTTIGEAKWAFEDALRSGLPSSMIDNGEWFMSQFGKSPLSDYASREEFYAEAESIYRAQVPSEGMKLYAFWAQPAGDAVVTVTPLTCGDSVTTGRLAETPFYWSVPSPQATVVGDAEWIESHIDYNSWFLRDDFTVKEGDVYEAQGGQTYYAGIFLQAKFGSYFANRDGITFTNATFVKWRSREVGNEVSADYDTALVKIPAVHDWDEATYIWSSDNKTVTASHTCKNLECKETKTETVNVTAKVTKQATCSAKGEVVYTASFAGDGFETQTKTAEIAIDPNAHEWGSPTYAWSADNEAATATRTCKHDDSHVQSEKVAASREVTKRHTCSAKGKATYAADFKNAAFAKQSKEVTLDIDQNNHAWGKPTYKWSKDNSMVVAVRKCASNATHMQVEFASSTSQVTKAATSKAAGTRTYTARFKASWAKTQKKDATIAKLPAKPVPVALAKLTTKGKTQLKLSWSTVKGAGRYLAYFAPCNTRGKVSKLKKVKTLGAGATSLVRGGLKENTLYKARIVAQVNKGGKWVTLSKSKLVHAATGNRKGNYTNATALALNTTSMTLKAGGTAVLSGLVQKAVEGEGMTAAVHSELLRFTSNNKRVAVVNARGKVTAKNSGTCTIYVQTSNGLWRSCTVTVK